MSKLTDLKSYALSHAGRTDTGFRPGDAGYLSDQEVAQLSETLGAEYLAFLKQTGLPDQSLIRTNFTKKLVADGRLPDNYSIGEGGRVVKDMSKTKAGLLAGAVVGGPALAYGLSTPAAGGIPHGGASVGYNATGSVVGGAGSAANTGTIAGPGIAGVEGIESLGGTAAGAFSMADVFKKLAEAGIPLAVGLTGHALANNGDNPNGTSGQIPDELKQLLAMSMKRMTDQQPLADAINKQALGGLPTYAKGGG